MVFVRGELEGLGEDETNASVSRWGLWKVANGATVMFRTARSTVEI